MRPGPDVDALVDVQIMGGRPVISREEACKLLSVKGSKLTPLERLDTVLSFLPGARPHYSTDMKTAWTVFSMFDRCTVRLVRLPASSTGSLYRPEIQVPEGEVWIATANSAAHAICLVALKAAEARLDSQQQP